MEIASVSLKSAAEAAPSCAGARRCADLSRDQVLCIYARVTEDRDRACELDFAAIVADCIDPAS